MATTDPSGIDRNRPSVVGGAGLGGSPPAPTLGAFADDKAGSISFGSGTTPAAGTILTVTWQTPRDPNLLPHILLQESSSSLAGVDLSVGTVTSTGFTVVQATRLVAASQPAGTFVLTYLAIDV